MKPNRTNKQTSRPVSVKPIAGDGTDANGRIGLDTLRRVTRDEALERMCHHIKLACIFYEASPNDEAAALAEVERILSTGIKGWEGRDLVAARAFLAAMNAYYAELKREQDIEDAD